MSDKDVQPRPSPYLRPIPPAAHLARSTVSLLVILIIVLLILSTTLGPNGLVEFLRLRQERDQLLRNQAALRSEVTELEARLQALRSDPFALEKLARERYNMRRPEEQVILLVPDRGRR